MNHWEQWLADLPEPQPTLSVSPVAGRHHLLYSLELSHAGNLRLSLHKGYLKKDGQWSRVTHYHPEFYSLAYGAPQFLEPLDVALLRMLHGAEFVSYGFLLEGARGGALMAQLPLTGRLRLGDHGVWLKQGPEQGLEWAWTLSEQSYRLQTRLATGEPCRLLCLEPLIYLDPERGLVGPLQSDLPASQAVHLSRMPPVPVAEFGRAAVRLRQRFPVERLPLPEEPTVTEVGTPVPHLRIVTSDNQHGVRFPGAILSFEYGDCRVEPAYDDHRFPLGGELIEPRGGNGWCGGTNRRSWTPWNG